MTADDRADKTIGQHPMRMHHIGFAGFGLAQQYLNYDAAMSLVAGVFCGSAAWWLTLSYSVGLLRTHFNSTTMGWTNKLAGVTICIFGVVILGSLWQ